MGLVIIASTLALIAACISKTNLLYAVGSSCINGVAVLDLNIIEDSAGDCFYFNSY
ncbi:hypothetical protein DICPUDRAFT_159324 [Dictyostelium purpureum]|uniref:Uncharacterized protein n=1 Tax=Dictyostelium purpureum TaxID=5786 RepID=F1A3U4_DICPU|nr:uncharacterized protein DICPUDRAFT_159324 [Dictyostelium purpureum]EGC29136.1 hypothetical protein DICPUDRAFT_159324 [Dictyostelium purpureum]|eukprot:XP_003294339.1 hypothetical protein DICPUDRAFT_159324 [Dictyostelium purpureum]